MEFSPSLKWSEGNLRIWRGIKTNKNLRLKPAISHPRACATITDAELIQIPAGLMAHTSVRYSGPQGPATSCSGFTILMCMLGWFIISGPGERLTPVLSNEGELRRWNHSSSSARLGWTTDWRKPKKVIEIQDNSLIIAAKHKQPHCVPYLQAL